MQAFMYGATPKSAVKCESSSRCIQEAKNGTSENESSCVCPVRKRIWHERRTRRAQENRSQRNGQENKSRRTKNQSARPRAGGRHSDNRASTRCREHRETGRPAAVSHSRAR